MFDVEVRSSGSGPSFTKTDVLPGSVVRIMEYLTVGLVCSTPRVRDGVAVHIRVRL